MRPPRNWKIVQERPWRDQAPGPSASNDALTGRASTTTVSAAPATTRTVCDRMPGKARVTCCAWSMTASTPRSVAVSISSSTSGQSTCDHASKSRSLNARWYSSMTVIRSMPCAIAEHPTRDQPAWER